MKKLISIIIAAYNAEKFLHACLSSIIKQNAPDLEILIINDGSTDTTDKIATNYQNKYDNIRVITQCNQGVSQARNTGIEKASGKYLFFVDADDQLLPNAIKRIREKISVTKADYIMINYQVANAKGEVISKSVLRFFEEQFPKKEVEGREALKLLFEAKISHWSWEIIVKRTLYLQNKILFPVGQRYGEDFGTTFKLLFFSEKVAFVYEYAYQYSQISTSAMHTPRTSDSMDYLNSINAIDVFVADHIPEYQQISAKYEITRLINAYSITCKDTSMDNNVMILREKIRTLLFLKLGIVKNQYTISKRNKLKLILIRTNLLPIIYRIYFKKTNKK